MSSSWTTKEEHGVLKINCVWCDNALVVICFKTLYNKTITIRFGFCDIRRLRLIALTSTLIIPDSTKTSSNNCLLCNCTYSVYGICASSLGWSGSLSVQAGSPDLPYRLTTEISVWIKEKQHLKLIFVLTMYLA